MALPTFSGTGADGNTIVLVDTVNGVDTQVGTGTVTGGTWTITANAPLQQGANLITAYQLDGNVQSALSGGAVVTLDTIAPTVASLAASGGSIAGTGNLHAGQVVTLTVALSEAVSVTTTGPSPTLTLNNGATATYDAAASDSTHLRFTYTVQAGDDIADLAVTGIDTQGAAIEDAAGNAADLSGAVVNPNGTLRIDTIAPVVSAVVATGQHIVNGDGDLKAGAVVTLTVSFNEAVVIDTTGGAPGLSLTSGGTATYVSASGTDLIFSYTVVDGDTASDLTIASLNLNGATILDAAGNAADTTGAAINPAGTLRIDTNAPAAPSIAVIGGSDSVVSGQSGDTVISGTAEAGSTVSVTAGSLTVNTIVADGFGNWTYTLTGQNIAAIGQGSGRSATATARER